MVTAQVCAGEYIGVHIYLSGLSASTRLGPSFLPTECLSRNSALKITNMAIPVPRVQHENTHLKRHVCKLHLLAQSQKQRYA